MASNKFLLWDIDGTLIRGARHAAEAFKKVLREVYELDSEIMRIATAGKTDPQIVRETLLQHNLAHDAISERLPAFQRAYLEAARQIAPQMRDAIEVLPGVHAALDRLAPRAIHSLLTGNFLETARLKLDAAGLSRWFAWEYGAFGSDHEHRAELVPIAMERAAAAGAFDRSDVVVIGDTPNDIACARAAGVRVVAVATGQFDQAALGEADAVLPNLNDADALERAIFG
ncbi:MAG TPA: HAD family hydrolase [Herpetosiphonaceae bacterium]|nr:HAD family hydrolase [Herpetosiphonaceae bacterium]